MRPPPGLKTLLFATILAAAAALAACPPKHQPDGLMDPVLRRAILGRVWETVEQNYLYQDFGGLDWPEELTRYRADVGQVKDNAAFYQLVDTMIYALGDDHSIYLAPWQACEEDRYYQAPPAADGDGVAVAPAPRGGRLEVRSDVAYLYLPSFDSLAIPDLVDELLGETLDQGPLAGIVLDLRHNYGGYLEVAYQVLEQFVDGAVGSEYDDLGVYPVALTGGRHFKSLTGVPLMVLVDESTSSAAEIVAAVLQQRRGAMVIGRPTPGNTEAVAQFDFVDGSRLWLAVGGFRLPDGSGLEGTGVVPDLTVAAGAAGDPVLDAALANLGAP